MIENKLLTRLVSKVEKARAELDQAVKAAQLACLHTHCGEVPYKSRFVPFRICLNCGITEDSWGPGHVVLTAENPIKVDRDAAAKARLGLVITDRHKELLLRKAVTLRQLIETNGEIPPESDEG